MILKNRRVIDSFFKAGLFLKFLHGLFELFIGLFLFFVSEEFISRSIIALARHDLIEDSDFITHHLLNFAAHFSVNMRLLFAVYLCIFGIINLSLVYALSSKKWHFYPLAAFVFFLLILYQIHRYFRTHSIWLIIISLFDVVLIYLILTEYNLRKKGRKN